MIRRVTVSTENSGNPMLLSPNDNDHAGARATATATAARLMRAIGERVATGSSGVWTACLSEMQRVYEAIPRRPGIVETTGFIPTG
jgi:hypothetical protein